MSLTLHGHPLSSFSQKVHVALYENDTKFASHLLDLGNEQARAAFRALWPIGKMPVLRDEARDRTVPESSIIIEYLAQHYPGPTALVPHDADLALRVRAADRFYDLYEMDPMQRIVFDRLRPPGQEDPLGVAQARTLLQTAYDLIDKEMAAKTWAVGDAFSMADCAAAPSLFYADWVAPFGTTHPHLTAYLNRLKERPSFARALEEAKPYRHMLPQERKAQ